MNNFIFENSTKTYFGKGCVKEYLAYLMKQYGKYLLPHLLPHLSLRQLHLLPHA